MSQDFAPQKVTNRAVTVDAATGYISPTLIAPVASVDAAMLFPDSLPAADALVATDQLLVFNAAGAPKRRVVPEAWPVGCLFISVVPTNPFDLLGYGTWVSCGAGRVLVGFDISDGDFNEVEKTGGHKTVASAGSNAAEASHTHGVTTNVAVGNHVVTQPNAHVVTQPSAHVVTQPSNHVVTQPANHTVTQPSNHVVTQPSAHASHTHSVSQNGFATAFVSQVSEDVEVYKSGGEVSTPTGGPSASLTHSGTAVDAHSGTAVSAHSGTAVDAHSGTAVSAHSGTAVDAHSGTAVDAHSVTNNDVDTDAGSSHTHAFTGSATSVVQPYLVAYFWKRAA